MTAEEEEMLQSALQNILTSTNKQAKDIERLAGICGSLLQRIENLEKSPKRKLILAN